jgi:hypothetical protein
MDALLRLALRHQLAARWQVEECQRLRERIASQGIEPKPLVKLMELKGYLHPIEINGLQQALGQRPADHALAEVGIRRGLVTFDQVYECLQEGPHSILDRLVEKGYLTADNADYLRATSRS